MWPALARSFDAPADGHPQRFRELIENEGGFTVHRSTGRRVASGISVSVRPSRSLRFARGAWCDHTVDQWMISVAAEPAWRGAHIGGWEDPTTGTVWLDVVRVVPRPLRWLALALGHVSGQHCVFDLGRRQTLVLS